MTEAKKHREFWINGDNYNAWVGKPNAQDIEDFGPFVHVIEYSAMQNLIDENEELKVEIFSLKREYADNHSGCCDCSMFKSLGKENAKLVEKLAEAEAKVRELEAALEGFRICPSCGEEYTITYTLSEREKYLITANAVLQKKLEKAVEQRNEQIDREFHESQANERDARKGILNLQLSRITAESIAKTEGEK